MNKEFLYILLKIIKSMVSISLYIAEIIESMVSISLHIAKIIKSMASKRLLYIVDQSSSIHSTQSLEMLPLPTDR